MINRNIMDELNKLGFGVDIDSLETYVINLQNADADGNPEVNDREYEKHVLLLKQLKPSSIALMKNWETSENDENDKGLDRYAVEEMTIVKSMEDLEEFRNRLTETEIGLCARGNLIGRGIRAIYKRGKLVEGSTVGKNGEWRSIIRHLKMLIPNYIEEWESYTNVEVRGDVVIRKEAFKMISESLKTRISAITHILRDNATENEIKLLDCVCYSGIIEGKRHIEGELYEEVNKIKDLGFNVPTFIQIWGTNMYNFDEVVEEILNNFEEMHDKEQLDYECDGVAVSVNNIDTLYNFGMCDNKLIGSFIIKMGRVWESNKYKSIVTGIRWESGKEYLIPIALIKPVITVTGVEVTEVRLQGIGVMERMHIGNSSEIHFKYDGKNGIRLCDDKID